MKEMPKILILVLILSACVPQVNTPSPSITTLTPSPSPTATMTVAPTRTPVFTPSPWPTPPALVGALTTRLNFPGLEMIHVYGPDPGIAAGEQVIMVATNENIAIYSKGGILISKKLLDGFVASLKKTGEDSAFDPRIVYDPWSRRFFLFTRAKIDNPDCKLKECEGQMYVAVSKSDNPITFTKNDWYLYAFDTQVDFTSNGIVYTQGWPDFTSIGVSKDALVLLLHMLPRNNPRDQFIRVRVFDKEKMINGEDVATWNEFKIFPPSDAQAVVHVDDANGAFYLAGSINATPCQFEIWRINNIFQSPEIKKVNVKVASCESGIDVPQPGGTKNGDGPSFQLNGSVTDHPTFRNGSLWVTQEFAYREGGQKTSAVLFVQFDVTAWPKVKVVQHAVVAQSGTWYFMPSLTVSDNNDVALVFACTDGKTPVSICYSGRLGSDPLDTMRPVATLKGGTAPSDSYALCPVQDNWGDYFGAAIDPVDDSAWIIGEYAKGSCWATWVGNLDWSVATSK